MDIFKLIYEHDLRLESLRARHTDRGRQDVTVSLESLLKPDPTYSRFYLSGTRLDERQFGLNVLEHYSSVMDCLETVLKPYRIFTLNGEQETLSETVETTPVGPAILLTKSAAPVAPIEELSLDQGSNTGHRKEPLRHALEKGELVLYKEQAHHGFDLHLFSRENIYRSLFFPFKELIQKQFRFFSINGKRIQSERKFYFETWALERPPHGVEEVFEQTVL
ncbi:MAG: hypothetical protein WD315_00025 [Balneolaceae bacterium]